MHEIAARPHISVIMTCLNCAQRMHRLAPMAVNARLRAEASSWKEMAAVHGQVYQKAVGEA